MLRVQGELPEGIVPYDEGPARRGYRLNRMLYELRLPERREALLDDPERFYRSYGLGDEEIRLLLARDWRGLLKAGANVYTLVKLGGTLGENLLQMGAQMRGEPFETFMARTGVKH
jgi:protocatechuate 4,5-dioxygenase alpha chain